jgi:ABC-2 type transport system permease protein
MSVCLGICVGLSGLSIGLGARFPVLGNRNPARIASGFGGTLNLIVSMVFVSLEMAGVGLLSFNEMSRAFMRDGTLSPEAWLTLPMLLALSLLVGLGALWIGARHFERLEC